MKFRHKHSHFTNCHLERNVVKSRDLKSIRYALCFLFIDSSILLRYSRNDTILLFIMLFTSCAKTKVQSFRLASGTIKTISLAASFYLQFTNRISSYVYFPLQCSKTGFNLSVPCFLKASSISFCVFLDGRR